eukprot:TRINITY_DN6522_c1_g2_i12.p1 TRINITY_DN6522_c1_g2~~TRINITY_DN6522_c1_g2_i12.p1  ORF type:complete len:504 (+),score=62.71 TRINITY_DN6522_c1_g2_i12:38-1549(+)
MQVMLLALLCLVGAAMGGNTGMRTEVEEAARVFCAAYSSDATGPFPVREHPSFFEKAVSIIHLGLMAGLLYTMMQLVEALHMIAAREEPKRQKENHLPEERPSTPQQETPKPTEAEQLEPQTIKNTGNHPEKECEENAPSAPPKPITVYLEAESLLKDEQTIRKSIMDEQTQCLLQVEKQPTVRIRSHDHSPLKGVSRAPGTLEIDFEGRSEASMARINGPVGIFRHIKVTGIRGRIADGLFENSTVSSLALVSDGPVFIGNNFLHKASIVTEVDLSGLQGVTRVGSSFLARSPSLQKIDLSPLDGVTEVGTGFLFGCSSLQSVDLSPLRCIRKAHGFLGGCVSLQSIDLSPLRELEDVDAFLSGCTGLTSVDFTSLCCLWSAGSCFLSDCTSIRDVDLSPLCNLEIVGSRFLHVCTSLRSVNPALPRLRTIGAEFMQHCTLLTEIDLSSLTGVENIAEGFFLNCRNLHNVDFSPLKGARIVRHRWLEGCPAAKCEHSMLKFL